MGIRLGIRLRALVFLHFCLDSQRKLLSQLNSILKDLYPRYTYVCKSYSKLLSLMKSDKKNQKGTMSIVGLKDLGEVEELIITDKKVIEDGLDFYREAFGR